MIPLKFTWSLITNHMTPPTTVECLTIWRQHLTVRASPWYQHNAACKKMFSKSLKCMKILFYWGVGMESVNGQLRNCWGKLAEGWGLTRWKNKTLVTSWYCTCSISPLNPNISTHILYTVLYTFPKVLTRRICFTIKSFFSFWLFTLFLLPKYLTHGWYCYEKLDANHSGGKRWALLV